MFHHDTKSQVREDVKQSRHVESSHNMWSGAIIKVASDLKYLTNLHKFYQQLISQLSIPPTPTKVTYIDAINKSGSCRFHKSISSKN